MKTMDEPTRKRVPAYAWIALAAISAVLIINMLALASAPGYANRFELETGAAWSDFSEQYPGVAQSLRMTESLFYVAYAGMALFAFGLSWFAFRSARRWSWYFMWVLPTTLILTSWILGGFQELGVSSFYGGLGLVTGVVLLFTFRAFFPNRD